MCLFNNKLVLRYAVYLKLLLLLIIISPSITVSQYYIYNGSFEKPILPLPEHNVQLSEQGDLTTHCQNWLTPISSLTGYLIASTYFIEKNPNTNCYNNPHSTGLNPGATYHNSCVPFNQGTSAEFPYEVNYQRPVGYVSGVSYEEREKAYAGLQLCHSGTPREILQNSCIYQQLKNPLVEGTKYYISFNASLGYPATSSKVVPYYYHYLKSLSVYFSDTNPNPDDQFWLDYNTTDDLIEFYNNNNSADWLDEDGGRVDRNQNPISSSEAHTPNWMLLKNSFVASQDLNWITIGEFHRYWQDGTHVSSIGGTTGPYSSIFYYIDDIKICGCDDDESGGAYGVQLLPYPDDGCKFYLRWELDERACSNINTIRVYPDGSTTPVIEYTTTSSGDYDDFLPIGQEVELDGHTQDIVLTPPCVGTIYTIEVINKWGSGPDDEEIICSYTRAICCIDPCDNLHLIPVKDGCCYTFNLVEYPDIGTDIITVVLIDQDTHEEISFYGSDMGNTTIGNLCLDEFGTRTFEVLYKLRNIVDGQEYPESPINLWCGQIITISCDDCDYYDIGKVTKNDDPGNPSGECCWNVELINNGGDPINKVVWKDNNGGTNSVSSSTNIDKIKICQPIGGPTNYEIQFWSYQSGDYVYQCSEFLELTCECCDLIEANLSTSSTMTMHGDPSDPNSFVWYSCLCIYDLEINSNPECDLGAVSYKIIDDASGNTILEKTGSFTFPIIENGFLEIGIPCMEAPEVPLFGSVFNGHVEIELSDGTPCIKEISGGCGHDCCDMINFEVEKVEPITQEECCYEVTIGLFPDFEPNCPPICGISRIENGNTTNPYPYDENNPTPVPFPVTYTDCDIVDGTTVKYIFYLADGSVMDCEKTYVYDCTLGRIKSTEENPETQDEASIKIVKLYNIPNPASEKTTIYYQLSDQCEISLEVYNAIGELVTTLYTGKADTGLGSIELNTDGYANGTYMVKLNACGVSKVLPINIAK